jgi:hypothetical protein
MGGIRELSINKFTTPTANGPNLMGGIEDFASGTYGLLALKTIQGGDGDVFVGKLDQKCRAVG